MAQEAVTLEEKTKTTHLEFIQQVVSRLASNSFIVKGWSATLATAMLGFAFGSTNANLAWVALVPIALFWVLDGYFLMLERDYRWLYDQVRAPDTEIDSFSMDAGRPGHPLHRWLKATVSISLVLFHAALLVSAIVAGVFASP